MFKLFGKFGIGLNAKERNYEAASLSPRTLGWNAPATSPNSSIAQSLKVVRNRSRQMVRDNAYAACAVQAIVSNTIGSGIRPRWTGDLSTQEKWNEWEAECDVEKRLDFYALQMLALRTIVVSGEVILLRAENRVQIIEGDHIDDSKNGMVTIDGRPAKVIRGIEFDADGRRSAYWILPFHPSDPDASPVPSIRYSIENVIHAYRIERPGQYRGMPWAAPILLRAKDFDGFEDAFLLRQRLANCFAGFIYDDSPDSETVDESILPNTLEPGILPILPPGKRIDFSNPPAAGGYSEYMESNLRSQSAGWGITYEAMTGDLSKVNYSSGRMGRLEMMRNVRQWQELIVSQICKPILKWIDLPPATWVIPKSDMVDPSKELMPIRDGVRAGLIPPLTAIQQLGYAPQQVYEEWKEFLDLLSESGAKVDSNPKDDKGRNENTQ